jgi:hypothetical protein
MASLVSKKGTPVQGATASNGRGAPPLWVVVATLVVLGVACTATPRAAPSSRTSTETASAPPPSMSPSYRYQGGQRLLKTPVSLPPWQMPYPYTTPTPPDAATPIDGTYLRIVTLEQTGGPLNGLPIKCFRCLPYRLDAGVSSLILFRGSYYVAHQLSGFHSLGHYLVHRNRVTFANDPNCPTTRGTYEWSFERGRLQLHVVSDPCPFSGLRAADLTNFPWTRVDACVFRIRNLWPAELGC